LPIKRAAACAGICEDTYYEWKNRAKAGESGYTEFSESLEQAEGEAQAVLVQKLQKDGTPTSWQFILERRWADEWGRKTKFEHSGPDGEPIPHSHSLDKIIMESIDKFRAIAEARQA